MIRSPLRTVITSKGPSEYHLGAWQKQSLDRRDQIYALKLHPAYLGAISTKADNRNICSPVVDQGSLGSCTANAFAALIEANENRRVAMLAGFKAAQPQVTTTSVAQASDGSVTFSVKVVPASSPAPTPAPSPAPAPSNALVRVSRLFEYYATRQLEGTVNKDSGASVRDTIKASVQSGVVDEALWPYDITKFSASPPQSVWAAAALHKVTSYHAISDGDITTMKSVLSAPIPFLIEFGFNVYSYFLSTQMSAQGLLGLPKKTERLEGGHAVVLVGYDDSMKMPDNTVGAFLVRNSWGTSWGLKGYFWMSYAYVQNTGLSSDFWIVQSAPINPLDSFSESASV